MAKPVMNLIKQIQRTIIFEVFDSTKDSLRTILDSAGDNDELSLEDFFERVQKSLQVKSFEEFIHKFAPTFYQIVGKDESGNPTFAYTTEKPPYSSFEISLKNSDFMNAVLNLVKDKEASGQTNKNTNYDDFKKYLSPAHVVERMKNIRKNIDYNMRQYIELTEVKKLPKENAEVKKILKLARDEFKNVVETYKKDPFLPLLTLKISDIDSKIKLLESKEKDQSQTRDNKAIGYMASFDSKGNIQLIEHTISDQATSPADSNKHQSLIRQQIEADWGSNAPENVEGNSYCKDLILSTLANPSSTESQNLNLEELYEEKRKSLEVYNNCVESLVNTIIPAVEKFIGVKEFFDHATTPNGELEAGVIISNCRADSLIDGGRVEKNFIRYFGKERGIGSTTTTEERIWFAILPAVNPSVEEQYLKEETTYKPAEGGIFDDFDLDEDTNGEAELSVSLPKARRLIDILQDSRITTFFNFKATESTSFRMLTEKKVREYKKIFEKWDTEYAVFSFPNFTVLPKEHNSIETGVIRCGENNNETPVYISLKDGLYLDSAYVAAGMTVGSQNLAVMKDKLKKINPDYPFVRFDFETNNEVFPSKVNKQTTHGMEKAAKDAILEDRFGFVFSDSNKTGVNSCYIINARTLKKDNQTYRNIYKTLVMDLITLLLSIQGPSTVENIKKFNKEYASEWKDATSFGKCNNLIFMEGEELNISHIEDNEISVIFGPQDKVLLNLKITAKENQ